MRLLLTNDDGIDAPGLAALERVAALLGEVSVVAPLGHFSGCSHQVTTHRPLRVEGRGERRWAVAGWPADCTRVALRGLGVEADWVLSGINAGGNMWADVYISGTVAAVREAALLGRPGVAATGRPRLVPVGAADGVAVVPVGDQHVLGGHRGGDGCHPVRVGDTLDHVLHATVDEPAQHLAGRAQQVRQTGGQGERPDR